eukprot:TRINITY_DN10884_c0_g3_i2.p1 TRINITY_DN10884_c0_g3~~TRINITY_DN10884_c0_g3_i2.p1  ORF type:complete len:814 (+),score=156.74 TRINITY_DN10884_c0_g3_i2:65-2443(+)
MAAELAAALGPPCSGILSSLNLNTKIDFVHAEPEDATIRATPRLLCLRQGRHHDFDLKLCGKAPVQISGVGKLGAAHAAGALDNDLILAINGQHVDHLEAATVTPLLRTSESHIKMLVIQPVPALPFTPMRRDFEVQPYHDALGFSWQDEDDDDHDGSEPHEAPGHVRNEHEKDLLPTPTMDDDVAVTPHGDDGGTARSPETAAQLWTSRPSNLQKDNMSFQHLWSGLLREYNKDAGATVFHLDATQGHDDWQAPHWSVPKHDEVWQQLVNGVPHNIRPQLWLRCTKAAELREECPLRYDQLVACGSFQVEGDKALKQIRKDLLRTFPTNILFRSHDSEGIMRLRRVLVATSYYQPAMGYCQGLGMLVAWALLLMEEEEAFWFLQGLLREHMSDDYYGETLMGAMADQQVLKKLVATHLPRIHAKLEELNIELTMVTLNWFITAFAGVAPTHFTLRIWDCFVFDGRLTLFKVTLALLTLIEKPLLQAKEPGDVLNILSAAPQVEHNPSEIIKLSYAFQIIEEDLEGLVEQARADLREHYAAYRQRLLARSETVEEHKQTNGLWSWFKRDPSEAKLIAGADKCLSALGEASTAFQIHVAELGHKSTTPVIEEALEQLLKEQFVPAMTDACKHGLKAALLPHRDSFASGTKAEWSVFASLRLLLIEGLLADEPEEAGLCDKTELDSARTGLEACLGAIEAAVAVRKLTELERVEAFIRSGLNAGMLHAWMLLLHRAILTTSLGQAYSKHALLREHGIKLVIQLQAFKYHICKVPVPQLQAEAESRGGGHVYKHV